MAPPAIAAATHISVHPQTLFHHGVVFDVSARLEKFIERAAPMSRPADDSNSDLSELALEETGDRRRMRESIRGSQIHGSPAPTRDVLMVKAPIQNADEIADQNTFIAHVDG